MGDIVDSHVIIWSLTKKEIEMAKVKAKELGLKTTSTYTSDTPMPHYLYVLPSGGKVGWEHNNQYCKKIDEFIEWLDATITIFYVHLTCNDTTGQINIENKNV